MTSSLVVPVSILPHGEDLPLPRYATPGSAGLDLHAALENEVSLNPGERSLIPTGLKIELPQGYEAQIRPRSGLALEYGVTVLNAPGTIDSDYRGELKVLLVNHGVHPVKINRAMKIAQLIIAPVMQAHWQKQETLALSGLRGEGGFGSTGY